MAAIGYMVLIGRFDGAYEHAVAHGAAIDVEMRGIRGGAVIGAEACKPIKAGIFSDRIDWQRVIGEVLPHNATDAAGKGICILCPFARIINQRSAVMAERKADIRMRHGDALDHIGDGLRFGAVGF